MFNREMIFGLVGGLGLFLFGMQILGEGLQKAAGTRLRKILEILTSNPLLAIIVGAFITAIIQSSSATTVMVVGFVNAGLMNLKQATGVIMGANIGTTITAQIIAFKLDEYALPSIALGFLLILVSKKKFYRHIGQVILGFGILFLGMGTMTGAMRPLRSNPEFIALIDHYGNIPIWGIIVGIVMTAIVQSSSATIGILLALASQGLVTIDIALPILFGDNIGTTVTAFLSSIGASRNAKRTAIIHLTIKLIGTIFFMIMISPLKSFVTSTSTELPRQIANAHTIFNVGTTIILLPFIKQLVRFSKYVFPSKEAELEMEKPKLSLDPRVIKTPSIALNQVRKELIKMGELANKEMKDAFYAFVSGDMSLIKEVNNKESLVNSMDRDITSYLVSISQKSLTDQQSKELNGLINIVNDLERIGDHSTNIAELAEFKDDNELPFSAEAVRELTEMFNEVEDIITKTLKALKEENKNLALEVLKAEDRIDLMEKELRHNHISRLNKGICNPSSGVIFLDVISNFERMGDHAAHIAHIVLGHNV